MSSTVIPIHSPSHCSGGTRLAERTPEFSGDAPAVQRLVQALESAVAPHLGIPQPLGAWLRGVTLGPDEAHVVLAKELGCRGYLVATVVFDTLRARLHDTDIFVGFEKT